MEISQRTRRIVAPALAVAVGVAGVAAFKPGGSPNRDGANVNQHVAPDQTFEHSVDEIAQKTYKALAEAEARRLSKGTDHPVKTDTNLFPAGVVGEPGGSSDCTEAAESRPVAGLAPADVGQMPAETGVDHGVTGLAEQGLSGTTEPAGPINGGTSPTGEEPVLSRPLAVPEALVRDER